MRSLLQHGSVNDSSFSIAILGNDAFLAASPSLPVQLMHAALAAGFNAVVPVSLGDELVAGETLRLAQLRGRRPVVQCACPFAMAQLCREAANLADAVIAVAPAVVALARALRSDGGHTPHITYIGACPGAQDPSIDLQVLPEPFLRGLQQKGIETSSQPDFFTDRIPADRRRFLSLPGGAPHPELIAGVLRRNAVALSSHTNPILAVADAMFDGGVAMIDPAGAYRCICAGADQGLSVADGRLAITQHEPARATTPVIEAPAWLDLRPTALPVDTLAAPDHEPAASPVAAAGAARPDMQHIASAERERPPQPHSSSTEAARRLHAVGVRSTRRRAAPAPTTTAEREMALGAYIPPTAHVLHAQPIEREVSLREPHTISADRGSALRAFLAEATPG